MEQDDVSEEGCVARATRTSRQPLFWHARCTRSASRRGIHEKPTNRPFRRWHPVSVRRRRAIGARNRCDRRPVDSVLRRQRQCQLYLFTLSTVPRRRPCYRGPTIGMHVLVLGQLFIGEQRPPARGAHGVRRNECRTASISGSPSGCIRASAPTTVAARTCRLGPPTRLSAPPAWMSVRYSSRSATAGRHHHGWPQHRLVRRGRDPE